MELAKATGELELLQNGLAKMPPAVTHGHLLGLKRLVLVAQHFAGDDGRPVFPDGMTSLHTLWAKRCELNGLDHSVGLLRGLTDLDLSENALADLHPRVFRHLKKLEVVRGRAGVGGRVAGPARRCTKQQSALFAWPCLSLERDSFSLVT